MTPSWETQPIEYNQVRLIILKWLPRPGLQKVKLCTRKIHFKSFLSKPVNIRTWTLMKENACKSLRFNTIPVITTRFGRKRGTLECGLHDVACVANVIGEGEGRAPNSLIFSCFRRSPSLSPMYSASHCSFESKWRRLWSARERLPLA